MGHLGAVVTRASCAVAIIVASVGNASAGSVTLSNGITGTEGFTSVSPDDFGTFGFLIGQQFDDEFEPAGVGSTFTPTYLSGPMLFVTTGGTVSSRVLLTGVRAWADFVENPPPTPDGIDAMHTGLTRTVTSPIAITATNEATSAFQIADASTLKLDFDLVQRLTTDITAVTSQVDQIYTITNTGTVAADIVFHLMWDADLYFDGNNQETDDNVGVGAGLCGVYMHDGDPRWSLALGNGPSSTVPLASFYGGKEGVVPGTGPGFTPVNAAIDEQWIWINHGMPIEWRNYVAGPGVGATGESDPALVGDATIGSEYRFSLAVGATETIHIRRYYGAIAIPCFSPMTTTAGCGNGVLDPGELCDGTDTATCNGATCAATMCGDSYVNTPAGEHCDNAGVDTATCNALTCTEPACGDGYVNAAASEACDDGGESAACNADCTPAMCGDGHVNAMAAEDCEAGELCDMATCTFAFTLGGGCAGCGAGGDTGAPLVLLVWFSAGRWRRRRRARAA